MEAYSTVVYSVVYKYHNILFEIPCNSLIFTTSRRVSINNKLVGVINEIKNRTGSPTQDNMKIIISKFEQETFGKSNVNL